MKKKILSIVLAAMMTVQGVVPVIGSELEEEFIIEDSEFDEVDAEEILFEEDESLIDSDVLFDDEISVAESENISDTELIDQGDETIEDMGDTSGLIYEDAISETEPLVAEENDLTIEPQPDYDDEVQDVLESDIEGELELPVRVGAEEAWLWPLEGCQVVLSNFGWRDLDGNGTLEDKHQGIDIIKLPQDSTRGMPVRAAKSGTVIISKNTCGHYDGKYNCGCNDGAGNYVVIQHADGTFSRYLHLLQSGVHELGPVSQGETIGYVGTSGWSYGYHLHFDMCTDINNRANTLLNPMPTNGEITIMNTYSLPSGWPSAKTTYVFDTTPNNPEWTTLTTEHINVCTGEPVDFEIQSNVVQGQNGCYFDMYVWEQNAYAQGADGIWVGVAGTKASYVFENPGIYYVRSRVHNTEADIYSDPIVLYVTERTVSLRIASDTRLPDNTFIVGEQVDFEFQTNLIQGQNGYYFDMDVWDSESYAQGGDSTWVGVFGTRASHVFSTPGKYYARAHIHNSSVDIYSEPVIVNITDQKVYLMLAPGQNIVGNTVTVGETVNFEFVTNYVQGEDGAFFDMYVWDSESYLIGGNEGVWAGVYGTQSSYTFQDPGQYYIRARVHNSDFDFYSTPIVINVKPSITFFKITYNGNGGINAPEPQEKTYGMPIALTEKVPTREGYDFLGWATSKNVTTAEYQPGDEYSSDEELTLYAVWKIKEYTIKYNANGGTKAPASQKKQHGITLKLSTSMPVREGYDFLGWHTSKTSATAKYNAGGNYTANSNATLYAVWKLKTYTISYDANGGSAAPEEQIKNHGEDLTLSTAKPTRTGYTFQGWSTKSDASTVEYAAGATYIKNASVTLYAVWKVNTYKVTYNANGGANAPAIQTKIYGKTLTLSSQKPTRGGYNFLGWATKADAIAAEYAAGASYTKNANATLYAVWKIKTFTVTYNANGGSGAPAKQTKAYGVNLKLSTSVPKKNGYNFLGWAESSTATTAKYKAGATFSTNNNATLYAVWEKALQQLKITAVYNSVYGGDIRWKTIPGADSYVLYRTRGNDTVIVARPGQNDSSYIDTSIKDNCWGCVYNYSIVAVVNGEEITYTKNRNNPDGSNILQRLAPMKITSVDNNAAGKVTVKWALDGGTNKSYGYEVQYAESSSDLNNRTGTFKAVTVDGRNIVSKVIGGLKKGKTYYFRVRTYVIFTTSGGKQIKTWSQFSKVMGRRITK